MFQAVRQRFPISRIDEACPYRLVPIMGSDIIQQIIPIPNRRDKPPFGANILRVSFRNPDGIMAFVLDILIIGIGMTQFRIFLESQIFRHPPLGTYLYNLVLVAIAFVYNRIKDYFRRFLRNVFYATDERMLISIPRIISATVSLAKIYAPLS